MASTKNTKNTKSYAPHLKLQYLPQFIHTQDHKIPNKGQTWELATYKKATPITLQTLAEHETEWRENQHHIFWLPPPVTWRELRVLSQVYIENWNGQVSEIQAIRQLVYAGLLQPDELVKRHSSKSYQFIRKLYYQTIPSRECVRKMQRHVFQDPGFFLSILSVSLQVPQIQTRGLRDRMLPLGKNKAFWYRQIIPLYALNHRIPIATINRFLHLSPAQRYKILSQGLRKAPSCGSPVILMAGKFNQGCFKDQPFGKPFRYPKMEIASFFLHWETAKDIPVLLVYHLSKKAKWLLLKPKEGISLIAPYQQVTVAAKQRIGKTTVVHILV